MLFRSSNAYRPFSTHSSDYTVSLSTRTAEGRIDSSVLQTSGDWGPRAQPYSLRELEAAVKNIQYNNELAVNFILANKVSTGNTGNATYTGEANPQGTLYQLHIGYNPDLDNAEGATPVTKWADYTNCEVPMDGASSYGNELPGSTTAYNRLLNIPQQDVYLSAEGKWRYLFDHIRLPVLTETY